MDKVAFYLVLFLCLLYSADIHAQHTQTIKGQVVDQHTRKGLIGAHVIIKETSQGTATDSKGHFRIEQVPVGRYSITVKYLGYKPRIIPEVLVGSAKEVELTISLEEDMITSEDVVVTPQVDKDRPLNSMSSVSARSFSVEETRRYAGGFDDPARLASSFAGVTYGNAQDNAIIIRGNAPKGLLWRLEGIDLPNANHFPDGNVLGGGLFTIFSNQLLTDSDFFTGAFPAEYGNALSGVFDMKMRNGNNDVREWTLQAGLMGMDVATEGPFTDDGNASYLVNYRYSTIGLLTDLNIINADQELSYQDLSFKLNFPTAHGTFSLWGIGSLDSPKETEEPNPENWEHDWDRLRYHSNIKVGAMGVNHKYILGESTFLNSTLAATAKSMENDIQRLDDQLKLRPNEFSDSFSGKLTLKSTVQHKFNSRLKLKSGFILNQLMYDLRMESTINDIPETYQVFVDESGNSQLVQAFSQVQMDVHPRLTFNGGLYYQKFMLNKTASLEPRAGLNWTLNSSQMLSFGYGRHSQVENIRYYLAQRPTENGIEQPNKHMGFTQADHFVLGYDVNLSEQLRLKVEPYYQRLRNVPVRRDDSFSFINLKDEHYINDPLVNQGTGTNIGVDITVEKFLSNQYYYLITASLFDSKYTGGDGVERNSRYNRNYVFNALIGKEIFITPHNILGLNAKLTVMGGERVSPVLYDASVDAGRVIFDDSRAFSKSLEGNQYLDVSVTYRINEPDFSHILALQVKNTLGSANDHGYVYSYKEQDVVKDNMVIVLPSISYKVEF